MLSNITSLQVHAFRSSDMRSYSFEACILQPECFFCKQIMMVNGSNGSSGEALVCAELLVATSAGYRKARDVVNGAGGGFTTGRWPRKRTGSKGGCKSKQKVRRTEGVRQTNDGRTSSRSTSITLQTVAFQMAARRAKVINW